MEQQKSIYSKAELIELYSEVGKLCFRFAKFNPGDSLAKFYESLIRKILVSDIEIIDDPFKENIFEFHMVNAHLRGLIMEMQTLFSGFSSVRHKAMSENHDSGKQCNNETVVRITVKDIAE